MTTQLVVDTLQNATLLGLFVLVVINQVNHRRHLRDHVEHEEAELEAVVRSLKPRNPEDA